MKFVDALPPSGRESKYDWPTIAAELKANKDQWGLVEGNERVVGTPEAAQGVSRFIRNGEHALMPKGQFESTTRGNRVYARYVGKKAGSGR